MKKSQIDELIKYNISKNNIQCCVTQVNYLGETAYEYAKGYGTREGYPVNQNTIFQVTSLTKPIIAALILLLSEAGKIHLDYSVGHYLRTCIHKQQKASNSSLVYKEGMKEWDIQQI